MDLEENEANMAAYKESFPELLQEMIKNNQISTELINEGVSFDVYFLAYNNAILAQQLVNKEELAVLIVQKLKEKIHLWKTESQNFWNDYFNFLFKKGIPMAFSLPDGIQFMGIIQGVTHDGKLQVMLEDDSVTFFNIKEIQMLF